MLVSEELQEQLAHTEASKPGPAAELLPGQEPAAERPTIAAVLAEITAMVMDDVQVRCCLDLAASHNYFV